MDGWLLVAPRWLLETSDYNWIMGQIVPDAVERYLASLNRAGDAVVTDNVLWDGEVVPGFVRKPARDPADTRAIAEYNERTAAHPALVTAIVPLRDGVSISVKTMERDKDGARGF